MKRNTDLQWECLVMYAISHSNQTCYDFCTIHSAAGYEEKSKASVHSHTIVQNPRNLKWEKSTKPFYQVPLIPSVLFPVVLFPRIFCTLILNASWGGLLLFPLGGSGRARGDHDFGWHLLRTVQNLPGYCAASQGWALLVHFQLKWWELLIYHTRLGSFI